VCSFSLCEFIIEEKLCHVSWGREEREGYLEVSLETLHVHVSVDPARLRELCVLLHTQGEDRPVLEASSDLTKRTLPNTRHRYTVQHNTLRVFGLEGCLSHSVPCQLRCLVDTSLGRWI